ncbi:hypothetical protein [Halosimplex pelagicum]|jgi:uncharacterized membrane protein YidH (DUF202 family)|uniref:Uncharacterized protein n=1 Tax=Halosimplex pelagicum TaxID=869886 RepID=A0A7D5P6S2_9EURY|nr:hypothetical protein [Halosimplex pelagicum]QLH82143.1 hypothetical protein HZS54_11240 [Halosimplex pelagicum]
MAVKQELLSRAESVKPYFQYLLGILLVINGIGLFTYSIGSGVFMVLAGLLVFPKVQDAIERHADTNLHPLVLAGAIGILFVASSALLLTAVDLSQAPDFLVPFEQ